MNEFLISRLNEALDSSEKSARRVSIEATGKTDTVRNIQRGLTKEPKHHVLSAIADSLNVSLAWLTGEDDFDNSLASRQPASAASQKRIPIYGTAAGSAVGAMSFNNSEVIDWTNCPSGLTTARDAYGLYVVGESMANRFNPGDLIFVHPHRPPRKGDIVVIQERNGSDGIMSAYLKEFVIREADEIITQQYNPPAEIRFKRDRVEAVHRVLTTNELFGL